MDTVVIPGDDVTEKIVSDKKLKTILGPGLRPVGDNVVACCGGILKKTPPCTHWVESHRKRYVPVKGEYVIGIVTNKQPDFYKVDIGSSEQATLSYLSFEGASKKNRIKIEIGDLLYGQLLTAHRDMEPELVCINSTGKSETMGLLTDGLLIHCSIDLVRKLLHPQCPIYDIGKSMQFEIAIGLNGRVWIKSDSVRSTVAIANVIQDSEFLSFKLIQALCDKILK